MGLSFIPLQGTVRKVKDSILPSFVANAAKSSANSVEWAQALIDNMFEIAPKDKRCYEAAQRAFLAQAVCYGNEYAISNKAADAVAARNYQEAARILASFVNKDIIEHHVQELDAASQVLTPERFALLVQLKREALQGQPWFTAIQGDGRASYERNLLRLMSSSAVVEPVRPAIVVEEVVD